MAKTFYTDHDIEDMVKRGIMSLTLNDHVVLTDLAYEKAKRLGMSVIRQSADTPPSAPVRPYMSKPAAGQPASAGSAARPAGIAPLAVLPADPKASSAGFPIPQSALGAKVDAEELRQRIRDAVAARLGNQVDPNLLNVIINRVLNSAGIQ